MAYVHGATRKHPGEAAACQTQYYRDQAKRLEAQLEAERTTTNKLRAALAAAKIRSDRQNTARDQAWKETTSHPRSKVTIEAIQARNRRIYADTPEQCWERLVAATREAEGHNVRPAMFDTRPCETCGTPTRSKHQPAKLFPDTLPRGGANKCKPCYDATKWAERKAKQ